MAKIIQDFKINLGNMSAAGTSRPFQVIGDSGAIFSLEIKNEDDYYYNFDTNTFAAARKRLKQKAIPNNGVYNGQVIFPTVTDNDQYDFYLWAESAYDTAHKEYSEVRFGDGSLDINSSTGSSSNLLQKVIYQYTDVTITLSAIAPETNRATTNFTSMSVSTDTITTGRGNDVSKQAFSIGITVAATKAVKINRQPIMGDLTVYTTAVLGDAVKIYGENIWAGTARSTDTVDGAVSSATKIVMDTNVATKMKVGDRITGTGVSSSATVTVAALNPDGDNVKEFSVSEEVSISDGVTLTFTPPYYYRYNVAAASSLHKLASGMVYIDSDWPAVARTPVGPYEDTTTYTTETVNEDGSINEIENIITNFSVPAIDHLGYKPTVTNGLVTKQLGNITFSDQVINDVDDTNAKLFYAYGPNAIKTVHNTEIKLTDLKVELTAPTTTTTAAVRASTTIPVADREGTIQNVSTISGIGIDSSVANPTVASATADGAGNWTASAAQTLESGITLTVGGTSRTATITGNIELENVDDTSFTLYFDVEKFLTAS